jgi:hypothetical protein
LQYKTAEQDGGPADPVAPCSCRPRPAAPPCAHDCCPRRRRRQDVGRALGAICSNWGTSNGHRLPPDNGAVLTCCNMRPADSAAVNSKVLFGVPMCFPGDHVPTNTGQRCRSPVAHTSDGASILTPAVQCSSMLHNADLDHLQPPVRDSIKIQHRWRSVRHIAAACSITTLGRGLHLMTPTVQCRPRPRTSSVLGPVQSGMYVPAAPRPRTVASNEVHNRRQPTRTEDLHPGRSPPNCHQQT